MEKTQLRRRIKESLAQITPEQREQKSRHICDYFIGSELFRDSSVLMVYLSMPHEVDTTPVILGAWQQEKTIAVPKISWQQRHMIPVEINSLEMGFTTEMWGLQNPVSGRPVPIEEIDIVITPGLAFDVSGNRLGRGGAYYDRFFESKNLRASRCAFAFAVQIVRSIPADNHDRPVDIIVTEEGIIQCR